MQRETAHMTNSRPHLDTNPAMAKLRLLRSFKVNPIFPLGEPHLRNGEAAQFHRIPRIFLSCGWYPRRNGHQRNDTQVVPAKTYGTKILSDGPGIFMNVVAQSAERPRGWGGADYPIGAL